MSFDPSSSVSSENNLSYLNQDNEIKPIVIRARRAPTTNDRRFKIGTLWVNQDTNQSYQLTSVSGGLANWVLLGVGAGDLESLTGNSGGAIFPDGSSNINIVGNDLLTVTGSGNTLTITETAGAFPITPFVVGPVGEAGYQTIQSALDAANAAGGGIVGVQPADYTENLTLYDAVHITGLTLADAGGGVNITGIHIPPTAGGFVFNNVRLISATHIFDSVAVGSAHLVIGNAEIFVTNGYTFNLPNWTGKLESFDVNSAVSINDGYVNNTGGAEVDIFNASVGQGSSNTMIISGLFFVGGTDIFCPIDLQTGSFAGVTFSFINNSITFSNNSTGSFNNSSILGGSNAAITMNSSGDFDISSTVVDSMNDPAIDGTGAGTLKITGVDFVDNFNIASTLILDSGTIHGGPVITPFVVGPAPDAPYRTIQSAIDAANTAPGGALVFVQPGTFTEDLTLFEGICVAGSI